jgi:peptidoglycan hydrolase CwlO-like protein
MQGSFDSQISQKDKEIRQLLENCKKFEQEIQQHDADFRKENEILRENFAQA